MNALIGWFAGNRVAANMLMLGIVGLGLLFIPYTPKEILPNEFGQDVRFLSSFSERTPRLACTWRFHLHWFLWWKDPMK